MKQTLLPRDQHILYALGNYYFLTSKQVQRLYFGKSLTWVQTRVMPRLVTGGYLSSVMPKAEAADYLAVPGYSFVPPGSLPIVYHLSRRGQAWLKKQGIQPPAYKDQDTTTDKLTHTIAVNDFLIGAELLTRTHPSVQIVQMLHERDFVGRPVQPDGFLRLRTSQRIYDYLIELDLGTESKAFWQKKVKALIDYVQGDYRDDFHASFYPTIAVITPLNPKRRDRLRSLTAEVIDSDLFLFSSIDPRVSPQQVFFDPVWWQARIGHTQPLFSDAGL